MAKSRKEGVSQFNLGEYLKLTSKKVHDEMKRLSELNLISSYPAMLNNKKTNVIVSALFDEEDYESRCGLNHPEALLKLLQESEGNILQTAEIQQSLNLANRPFRKIVRRLCEKGLIEECIIKGKNDENLYSISLKTPAVELFEENCLERKMVLDSSLDQQILGALRHHPNSSANDLNEYFQLNPKLLDTVLQKMVSLKLIERTNYISGKVHFFGYSVHGSNSAPSKPRFRAEDRIGILFELIEEKKAVVFNEALVRRVCEKFGQSKTMDRKTVRKDIECLLDDGSIKLFSKNIPALNESAQSIEIICLPEIDENDLKNHIPELGVSDSISFRVMSIPREKRERPVYENNNIERFEKETKDLLENSLELGYIPPKMIRAKMFHQCLLEYCGKEAMELDCSAFEVLAFIQSLSVRAFCEMFGSIRTDTEGIFQSYCEVKENRDKCIKDLPSKNKKLFPSIIQNGNLWSLIEILIDLHILQWKSGN